jgi:thioesterase domain-containing protein
MIDIASHYIERMRSIQPEGPYFLGGFCEGGNLAFEMAVQLQAQGQEVALLILIDSINTNTDLHNKNLTTKRIKRLLNIIDETQEFDPQKRIFYMIKALIKKTKNVIFYEIKNNWIKNINLFKFLVFRYFLDNNLPLWSFLQNMSVRTILTLGNQSYISKIFYGQVLLCRATEEIIKNNSAINDTPLMKLTNDPLLGWNNNVKGQIEIYDVLGGHNSMLQPPYVKTLAEKIEANIQKVILVNNN